MNSRRYTTRHVIKENLKRSQREATSYVQENAHEADFFQQKICRPEGSVALITFKVLKKKKKSPTTKSILAGKTLIQN